MLLDVAFREVDLDVGDVACLVTNGGIDGVHETFVGREVKFLIASQNRGGLGSPSQHISRPSLSRQRSRLRK